MSNIKQNNIFEKTSFLGGNSSEFIEELYADYLKNPQNIPEEWKDFIPMNYEFFGQEYNG